MQVDVEKETKLLLLGMQGLWTQKAGCSWSVITSTHDDDAPGYTHKSYNPDGTTRYMTRKSILTNQSMNLIGYIALCKNQLLMYKLTRFCAALPVTIYGGLVDCIFVEYDKKRKRETEG